MATKGHDERWVDHGQLPLQVRDAGLDLIRLGIAIVGRPALHDIRDEHLVALPADGAEHPDEQVPGPAHERPTGAILVLSRPLADEDDLGIGMALAGHGLEPAGVEPAAGTGRHLGGDGLERRAALG